MTVAERIACIKNSHDLSEFVRTLKQDYLDNPDGWENQDLLSFLEAMSAWIADSDGYYQNSGQTMPDAETWKVVATILAAAKNYE